MRWFHCHKLKMEPSKNSSTRRKMKDMIEVMWAPLTSPPEALPPLLTQPEDTKKATCIDADEGKGKKSVDKVTNEKKPSPRDVETTFFSPYVPPKVTKSDILADLKCNRCGLFIDEDEIAYHCNMCGTPGCKECWHTSLNYPYCVECCRFWCIDNDCTTYGTCDGCGQFLCRFCVHVHNCGEVESDLT